jgi:soluble lytic murein transglycosylase-like protein
MHGRDIAAARVGTALAAVFAVIVPSYAYADVIEVGADGAVSVHDRPSLYRSEGATPIVPEQARTARRAPPPAIAAAFTRSGDQVALSPLLLEAVAWAESRFNSNARSPAGAVGVMQLMPGTAAELGVDPTDPHENVSGGARYLREMLIEFDGDLELALAAYNAGPGAVRRYGGVPPYRETRAYVAAILGYLADRAETGDADP